MTRHVRFQVARRRSLRESGATAVEYALMIALIALAILVAVTLLGTKLSSFFTYAAGQV